MDVVMEDLVHKIGQLDEYQINWEKLEKTGYNIGYGEPYLTIWGEVIAEIRTLLKKHTLEECCERLNELTDRYVWLNAVLKYADASLVYYRGLAALRELDERGRNLAAGFIIQAFDNYIVKVNTEFSESWEQFGMKSENEMFQVLRALNSLAEFYVAYSYAKVSVKKDFEEESGLGEELCEIYSGLVDKNYMEMKMNLIFNKLSASE